MPVTSYADIERRINDGTSNRTVAATNMNATSSRAHTVVMIIFEQITKDQATGSEISKVSCQLQPHPAREKEGAVNQHQKEIRKKKNVERRNSEMLGSGMRVLHYETIACSLSTCTFP